MKISYQVIMEEYAQGTFEKRVQQALAQGWELVGGVSISHSTGNYIAYAQALVKKEQDK